MTLVHSLHERIKADKDTHDGQLSKDWSIELARRPRLQEALRQSLRPSDEDGQPLTAAGELEAGTQVGSYIIDGPLGEGGMGTIYLAHHVQEDVKAAIKVLKDNNSVNQMRFRKERRILARFQHPRIARFLNSGMLPDGRPWLAQEYVKGVPLDRWCHTKGLDKRGRLSLVIDICETLGYAHRNLVLHRDLKPANILVDEDGQPIVLDFGIASHLDPDCSLGQPGITRVTRAVMTPAYASPEQMRREPLTTASDVYGLGVLIYELLCGSRPYQLQGTRGNPAMQLAKVQITPPSQVDDRPPEVGKIGADLDTIILKALAFNAEERYQSMDALAGDLRRYLSGRPIKARRATSWYRFIRFARRNPAPLIAVTVFCLFLAGFSHVLLRQMQFSEAQRQIAEDEGQTARTVSSFLKSLFALADPGHPDSRALTADDLLKHGVERLEDEFKEPSYYRAKILNTLGLMQTRRGLLVEAAPLLEESLEYFREHNPRSRELMNALQGRGEHYTLVSKSEKAIGCIEEALVIARDLGDDEKRSELLSQMGTALHRIGQSAESLTYFEEAKALIERLLGRDSDNYSILLNDMAHAKAGIGDFEEARNLFGDALKLYSQRWGEEHFYTAIMMNNYAVANYNSGRVEIAEEMARKSLAIMDVTFPNHPSRFSTNFTFSNTLMAQGKYAEAEAQIVGALEGWQATMGETHIMVAKAKIRLGRLLFYQGEPSAERLLREGEIQLKSIDDHGAERADALLALGVFFQEKGEFEQSLELLRQAERIRSRLGIDNYNSNHLIVAEQAATLLAMDRPDDALRAAKRAVKQCHSKAHCLEYTRLLAQGILASCLAANGAFSEAEPLFVKTIDTLAIQFGETGPYTQRIIAYLADAYEAQGRSAESRKWRQRVVLKPLLHKSL